MNLIGVAERIKTDIDAFCVSKYNDGPRNHLGASLIGKACDRDLWYSFRWVKHKVHSARQYRLFNRGHKEEARIIEWLRGAGVVVYEFDQSGKQFRISGVENHYGGSTDGVADLSKYGLVKPVVLEFKTHSRKSYFGDRYNTAITEGVKKAKPQHFIQMSCYGEFYGLEYGLYLAVCKDTDDLHVELVKLDFKVGAEKRQRAAEIITRPTPPGKLANNPSYFDCKYCDHLEVCHFGQQSDINCRSCKFARPAENGEWHCGFYGQNIPAHFIKKGCQHWQDISHDNPSPVPSGSRR